MHSKAPRQELVCQYARSGQSIDAVLDLNADVSISDKGKQGI
jgi:hypothetical protein